MPTGCARAPEAPMSASPAARANAFNMFHSRCPATLPDIRRPPCCSDWSQTLSILSIAPREARGLPQHFRGAGGLPPAPRHDLVGTDERERRLVEFAKSADVERHDLQVEPQRFRSVCERLHVGG